MGVNTFLSSKGSPTIIPEEVIRSTTDEKEDQIANLTNLQEFASEKANEMLRELQVAAINNNNMFEALIEASKYCSLGQITHALFQVGGQYRRNM